MTKEWKHCKYCNRKIFGVVWEEAGYCSSCLTSGKPRIEELEQQNAAMECRISDLEYLLRQAELFCRYGSRYDQLIGTELDGQELSLQIMEMLENKT